MEDLRDSYAQVAERLLEVDDFLAHRLELHRVRDGEPGRLLLEYHLRLLVEFGAFCGVGDGLGL